MNRDRWRHLEEPFPYCNNMDWRHVCMIHAVLANEQPVTAIEMGSNRGYSAAAIVEAIEEGFVKFAEFVDLRLTPELWEVTKSVAGSVKLCQSFTADYHGKGDFWMIDAGHGKESHDDYARAMEGGARIVVIHDTTSANQFTHHFGAFQIGLKLKMECVAYFEDVEERKGEMTHRGLVIGFFYQPKAETVKALEECEHESFDLQPGVANAA